MNGEGNVFADEGFAGVVDPEVGDAEGGVLGDGGLDGGIGFVAEGAEHPVIVALAVDFDEGPGPVEAAVVPVVGGKSSRG